MTASVVAAEEVVGGAAQAAPAVAPRGWRLGRRPALDGLRGVGVLMVLLGHAGIVGPFDDIHVLGVEVFFVLSGFLITSILVEEHERRGAIDLLAFYGRRVRRLVPALVVLLAAVGALSWVTGAWDPADVARGQLFGLAYAGNVARVLGLAIGPFDHLWSLAVEEHFYLALPAVMALALRYGRRRGFAALAVVVVVGVVVSGLLRARWSADWERVYNGSDTRAGSLLVGCLLALALHAGLERVQLSTFTRQVGVASAAAGLLALSGIGAGRQQELLFEMVLPVAAVLSAVLVLAAVAGHGRVARTLSNTPLRWTGELSYGLYLWHAPIYLLLGDHVNPGLPLPLAILGIAMSFVAAMASMRLVEARFLHRKPTVLMAWEGRRR